MATYRIVTKSADGIREETLRHRNVSARHAFSVEVYEAIRRRAGLDTAWGVLAYEEMCRILREDMPGIHGAARTVTVQDIRITLERLA